jgi:hypothetical protein
MSRVPARRSVIRERRRQVWSASAYCVAARPQHGSVTNAKGDHDGQPDTSSFRVQKSRDRAVVVDYEMYRKFRQQFDNASEAQQAKNLGLIEAVL